MNPGDVTLQYYESHADSFAAGTYGADMSAAAERFIACLPERARILDFGCGAGRDTKYFMQKGFVVDAVDGSAELCRIASAYTGAEVKRMLFGELEAVGVYDGIWACASILHLPEEELVDVLGRIARALKAGGVLYTSFKYGIGGGMRNGRYFTNFTEETLREFWKRVPGLTLREVWISGDVRPGREAERWVNLLADHSITQPPT